MMVSSLESNHVCLLVALSDFQLVRPVSAVDPVTCAYGAVVAAALS